MLQKLTLLHRQLGLDLRAAFLLRLLHLGCAFPSILLLSLRILLIAV